MSIFDLVLFGVVATLIVLKVVLLAAAAVLLLRALTKRARQRTLTPARVRARHMRLDKCA